MNLIVDLRGWKAVAIQDQLLAVTELKTENLSYLYIDAEQTLRWKCNIVSALTTKHAGVGTCRFCGDLWFLLIRKRCPWLAILFGDYL